MLWKGIVSPEFHPRLRGNCVFSQNCPHQEVRWNHDILCHTSLGIIQRYAKSKWKRTRGTKTEAWSILSLVFSINRSSENLLKIHGGTAVIESLLCKVAGCWLVTEKELCCRLFWWTLWQLFWQLFRQLLLWQLFYWIPPCNWFLH